MGNEADCHGQNGQQPVLPCAVASPYGCTSSRRHVRAGRRQGQCNGHYQGTRDRTAEEPAKKARPKASHQHIDNPSRNHATEEGTIPILCRDRHKRGDGHKGRPQQDRQPSAHRSDPFRLHKGSNSTGKNGTLQQKGNLLLAPSQGLCHQHGHQHYGTHKNHDKLQAVKQTFPNGWRILQTIQQRPTLPRR